MIARRKIVLALGAGALTPFASFAQQPAKVFRIGFLGAVSAVGSEWRIEALRAGMRDLGYVEGRNFVIETRWSDGKNDRLPDLAAELVRMKVDVLVTHGTPGTLAAKQATKVPIVMAVSGDAVGTGIVSNLGRPGGNITGTTFFDPELSAKRLELLKEIMPRITRVAVLLNPRNPANVPLLRAMGAAAAHLKLKLEQFEVQGPEEFAGAMAAMAKSRVEALALTQDSVLVEHAGAIAGLAAKQRLASTGFAEYAQAGGLLGYGVNIRELFRRATYFVDKILRGAKPGDIPVEQPTKFEMVVNLKTAKALGIKIPQSILLQATKVIE